MSKGLDSFEPGHYYHVVNHAVGSENLFRADDNFHFFLKKYAAYMPSVCDTLAYCLMPNHIHFLIRIYDDEILRKHPKYKENFHKIVMQQLSNLLNSYAKAFNKTYGRKGALWLNITKRFKIEADSYLTSIINYIHQNPVKHGFVKSPEEWKHSSYHAMLSSKPTLLKRDEVIEWFGDRQAYIEFHKEQIANLLVDWEY